MGCLTNIYFLVPFQEMTTQFYYTYFSLQGLDLHYLLYLFLNCDILNIFL